MNDLTTDWDQHFVPADDALHGVSDSFYENETFWFSFFVPERAMGAWLYSGIRQNAGVSTGGMFVWDDSATQPADLPFYESFSWLKAPTELGPDRVSLPNGITITTIEPGMVYDLAHTDRGRTSVQLRFEGLEPPVPLRAGAPPYPTASHFDQTGRASGHLVLEGERIEIDCFAMRDRSWGPRTERGYPRVGYTWLADRDTSVLAFSRPVDGVDEVYAGYLRRDGKVSRLVSGQRTVDRDPHEGWVAAMTIDAVDEQGNQVSVTGESRSRMVLSGATNVCVNSVMLWQVDGREVHGEDQDVWSMKEWRQARRR